MPGLAGIVKRTGGSHWANGTRATIPAPGHSRDDQSVSLRLVGAKVLIHVFGDSSWEKVSDHLRALNLITKDRHLVGSAGPATIAPATPTQVKQVVDDILSVGVGIEGTRSAMYLAKHRNIVRCASKILGLSHVERLPVSSYNPNPRFVRPALVAHISDLEGAIHGVEVTYLNGAGKRDETLYRSRKMLGALPKGYMVRLNEVDHDMVVGEGLASTLSASDHYSLPAMALLSSGNLGNWTPPDGIRSVVIAADRGAAGEASATKLFYRVRDLGIKARIAFAPDNHKDFNDHAQFQAKLAVH